MRALVQRVTSASVTVEGEVVGQIGPGLLILACAMDGDDEATAAKLAQKIAKLRIFRDDEGRMNRALLDTGGAALVVSQFTLAADTSRGNRPGFSTAAQPELGEPLVRHFADTLGDLGIDIAHGRFGADMAVSLVNDGPVTIWLDTNA
ncbi:MAG: D-aminoacyl-tRNA deacylase [Paracoccaceae bacterium]|nr:D-aminoacyl-tRNA deacylase [Paracoccaceae bacterium]